MRSANGGQLSEARRQQLLAERAAAVPATTGTRRTATPVIVPMRRAVAVQQQPENEPTPLFSPEEEETLMSALKWLFIEPLRFIVQCLAVPLVMIPFQVGRGFWAIWFMVPATYIALSIATGDWSLPVEAATWVAGWAYDHPDILYNGLRIFCGLFVFLAVIEMFSIIKRTIFPPEPEVLKPINAVDATYNSAAIDNFRDKNAYGDAQHAKRNDITRALAGSGGTNEPFFEQ